MPQYVRKCQKAIKGSRQVSTTPVRLWPSHHFQIYIYISHTFLGLEFDRCWILHVSTVKFFIFHIFVLRYSIKICTYIYIYNMYIYTVIHMSYIMDWVSFYALLLQFFQRVRRFVLCRTRTTNANWRRPSGTDHRSRKRVCAVVYSYPQTTSKGSLTVWPKGCISQTLACWSRVKSFFF